MKNWLFIFLSVFALKIQAEASIADSLEHMGRYDEALTLREKLLAKDPEDTILQARLLRTKFYKERTAGKEKNPGKFLEEAIRFLKKSGRDSVSNTLLIQMYQSKYHFLYDRGDNIEKVLATALEVYSIKEIQHADISTYAQLCSDIAGMYSIAGDKAATIRFYQKAINEFKNARQPDYTTIGLSYNNLAYAYSETGYMHQVLKNYEMAHQTWITYCPEYIYYNNIVLQNLITTNIEYGDIKSAQNYLQVYQKYFSKYVNPQHQAIESLVQNDSILHAAYDFLKANIEVAIATNHLRKAENYLSQLKKLHLKTPASAKETYIGYVFACIENIGFKYKSLSDFLKSEQLFKSSQSYISNQFSQMKYHANFGVLYYDQKMYEKSLAEVDKALKLFPEETSSLSFFMLTVLKSELLMHLNQEKSSIQLLEILYRKMLKIQDEKWTIQKLTYKDFNQLNTSRHISILLKSAKIYELLHEQSKQKADLQQAANFYERSAEMFHQYYLKGFYNKDLDEYAKQIKEGLLATASAQKTENVAHLLNRIESNESQHLWKKFIDKNADVLGFAEDRLSEDFLLSIDTSKAQRKPVVKNQKFDEFSADNFQLKDIQQKLNPDEILIRYVVGEKRVFAFVIRQKTLNLIPISDAGELKKTATDYYHQLSGLHKDYHITAKQLYQKLLAPLKIEDGIRLTFVMEDFLHLLPMESLLDFGDFRSVKSVSYAYSLKMLEIQSNLRNRAKQKQIAIFAPEYAASKQVNGTARKGDLKKLFFAQKEADAILKTSQGKLFAGQNATKENFIQASSTYNVLHLAMHAIMDTNNYEQSYLAFQHQQPLYFSELYQMEIPAQLVILSACNTGNGLLENGEGFMSLSRAFTYAGVPATIHSLWEVPDKETADLMKIFYELLKEKLSPEEALFQSKKEFRQKYPQKSHPYFWAGFVINGTVEAEGKSFTFFIWLIFSVTAIVGLIGWLIWRKRK